MKRPVLENYVYKNATDIGRQITAARTGKDVGCILRREHENEFKK